MQHVTVGLDNKIYVGQFLYDITSLKMGDDQLLILSPL